MKLHLEIDTSSQGDMSDAYRVLNALKAKADAGPTGAAAASGPAAPTPSAPAPAAPAAAAKPSAPPPGAPSPAPAPAPASPSSPPPAPAPVAAAGNKRAELSKAAQAFAAKYTAKGTKARFAEMAAHFQQPTWTSQSAIPEDQIDNVLPWFAVE